MAVKRISRVFGALMISKDDIFSENSDNTIIIAPTGTVSVLNKLHIFPVPLNSRFKLYPGCPRNRQIVSYFHGSPRLKEKIPATAMTKFGEFIDGEIEICCGESSVE